MKKSLRLFYWLLIPVVAIILHTACNKRNERTATAGSAPGVEKVFPEKGAAGGTIVIDGAQFSKEVDQNHVFFGDQPATVLASTDSTLTVAIPENATTGKVTVSIGENEITAIHNFVIDPTAPVVSSFSPLKEKAGGLLTIKGSRFTKDCKVYFGELAAQVVEWVDANTLQVKVPEKVRPGKIRVVNEKATAISARNFFSSHVIYLVWPKQAGEGQEIVIDGEGFGDIIDYIEVSFGGQEYRVAAEEFISVTDQELRVYAPKAGKSGTVGVTVRGEYVTYDDAPFKYLTTIKDWYPKSGKLTDTITIKGSRFPDEPWVKMDGEMTELVKVTDSTLKFKASRAMRDLDAKISLKTLTGEHTLSTQFSVLHEWGNLHPINAPFTEFQYAPSFCIGSNVYFADSEELWIYEVTTNRWSKASLPQELRYVQNGTAVSYQGRAFFGLGENTNWYEYVPTQTFPWIKRPDFIHGSTSGSTAWGAKGMIFIGPGAGAVTSSGLHAITFYNLMLNSGTWLDGRHGTPHFTPNYGALSFVLDDQFAYILGGQRCGAPGGCTIPEMMTIYDVSNRAYTMSYAGLDVKDYTRGNSSTFVKNNVAYINARGLTYAYDRKSDKWALCTISDSRMTPETVASYVINNKVYGFDADGIVYEYRTNLTENGPF